MRRKFRIEASTVAIGCALVLYGMFVVRRRVTSVEDAQVQVEHAGTPRVVQTRHHSASVSGHVWTKERQPVVGARVCAVRASSDPTAIDAHTCASSGTDGAFRVTGLRAESYRVMASAEGFVSARATQVDTLLLRLGSDRAGLEIFLDHDGVELSGRVLDATGGPVPGAKVRIVHWQTPPLVAFVEADQAGQFVSWTPAGEVTLTASADGYAPSRPTLRVAPSRDVELTLIPGATVRGFVLTAKDGRPVAGVEVSATPLASPMQAAQAMSLADGSFVLSGLEPDNYGLFASAQGFSAQAPKVVAVELAALVTDVVITVMPAAQVDGTVLRGPEQTPCTQGSVTFGPRPVRASEQEAAAWPTDRTRDATTSLQATIESDGHFHFDAVPAARYFAQIDCAGARQAKEAEVVEVGEAHLEKLILRVDASPTLTVRAVDETGRPAQGARVTLEWPRLDGMPGIKIPLTLDNQGEFAFTSGLRDGRYRVAPFPPYEGEPVEVELKADAGHIAALIRLRGSSALAVTVRDTGGQPVDGLTVSVQRLAASPLEHADPSESQRTFAAASQGLGVYRAGPLAPGRYRVEVTDGFNPPIERSAPSGPEGAVELFAGRESELSVRLSRTGQIRGRVVDADGTPVENAWVSVANEAALAKLPPGFRQLLGPVRRSLTEPDGTFLLSGLDLDGRFSVRAEQHDASSVKVSRDVAAGSELTITLPSAGRLAGTVSDEQGRLVDDFVIELAPSELDNPRVLQFSRAQGKFAIDRVPSGRLNLSASSGHDLHASSQLDLSSGTTREDLQLTLRPLAALESTQSARDRADIQESSSGRGL